MKWIALVALLLTVVGCASGRKAEAEIQEKISRESVPTREELSQGVHDLISKSKTLTDAEKTQLSAYIEEVRTKNHKLHTESLKLRQLMIKELLSEKPNRKEVALIKKKIKKIESERTKNMLKAIDKVTADVSKDPQCEAYVNHMLAIERPVR